MPPLKGIDRGIDGKLLLALEELGHGDQIAIVDPSYPLPKDAYVKDYHGDSSAQALRGILELVDPERTEASGEFDVVVMEADESPENCTVTNLFRIVANDLGLEMGLQRRDKPTSRNLPSFYLSAQNHNQTTLFIRTRDQHGFACARFIVAAAQNGD